METPKFKPSDIAVVNISDLKTHHDNPRFIKDEKYEKLKTSMESFSEMAFVKPITVNKDNVILAGNMRYRAAKELGWKKIPVITANFKTPDQEREFMIKDNTHFGEWDWDVLANEWKQPELLQWGFEPYNFGADTDILGLYDESDEGRSDSSGSDTPKITDEGFTRFEIIIPEEGKISVVNTLNDIKGKHGLTLGDSFMRVFNSYNK